MSWSSEPDEGMYDGINKGMRLASGDILAYLNSDDLYPPWALDVVVDAFERDPEVDVVFGDVLGVQDGSDMRTFGSSQILGTTSTCGQARSFSLVCSGADASLKRWARSTRACAWRATSTTGCAWVVVGRCGSMRFLP